MFIQGSVACMLYVRVGMPTRSAQLTSLEAVEREGRRLIRMQIQQRHRCHPSGR